MKQFLRLLRIASKKEDKINALVYSNLSRKIGNSFITQNWENLVKSQNLAITLEYQLSVALGKFQEINKHSSIPITKKFVWIGFII